MKTEVVIVGGGPAGSASALFAAKAGIRSIIVEKDSFPRYHIGESLTGECGALLRMLGFEDCMAKHSYPIKYGTTVYGKGGKNAFHVPVMTRSPEGELADSHAWQVRRSLFDRMLLDEAAARGTTVIKGRAVAPLLASDGTVKGVRIRTSSGKQMDIESEVLIDASGQSTFLSNAGITSRKEHGSYNKQVAIFSQVDGAIRDDGRQQDDTLIFYQQQNFWSWFIPLDSQTVSVGVVTPSDYFKGTGLSKRKFLERKLSEINPELTWRVAEARTVDEVRAISNYSYHVKNFTGKGYLCVGDSHRFIDPIFSFGVFFSLKEAQFASEAILAYLGGEGRDKQNPFDNYERLSNRGQDLIQDLIDGFWSQPLAFAFFVHQRYRGDFVDMFAGRIYSDDPLRGHLAIKAVNAQASAGATPGIQ